MTEQQEVKPEIQDVVPELEQPQEEIEPAEQEVISFKPEEWKNLTTDLQESAVFDEKTQKYVLPVTKYKLELKYTPNLSQNQMDAQTELILIEEKHNEIIMFIKALSSPSCVLPPEEKKKKMDEYVALSYVILETLVEKEKRYRLNSVQLNEMKKSKKKIELLAPLEGFNLEEAAKKARTQIDQEIFEKVRNCTKAEAEMKLKENMENNMLQKSE